MSKYKLGDFVRLVEEDAEGYITAILNDGMIAVTGEDGFEIPVPATKVTLVYGKMDTEEDKRSEEAQVPQAEFKNEGIYLAITGDPKQGLVEFFVVNESSYQLMFAMNTKKADQIKGEFSGQITAHAAEKIYTANAASIGNWPVFNFQLLFFSKNLLDVKKPLIYDKKIRPVDLSTSKKEVPVLGMKAWIFRLDEEEAKIDTDKLQEHFFSHRPNKK
ncbi:hypothetical protein [Albibacterium bauzanense]|uniref:DUF2027 domain-containing protein n=1 Tax=Albibacterium bauzanense TaxID=653929 RepID=A0A4R1M1Y7_9SPHI|nr:hypothetical protein [Albibacterium bauzanense]TCK85367.1 hypothetical protein C8N28_0673 [Albibacterium bauzanense]